MEPYQIVFLTVALALGYIFIVWVLFEVVCSFTTTFKKGSLVTKLLILIPLLVFGTIFFLLDIIHSLLAIALGVQAAAGFRNWWHRTH